MNYQTIKKMQKEYDVFGIQAMINSGDCWKLEGSVGRYASNLLDVGVCMLPKKHMKDYYGNRVPSRDDLKSGTKGTYLNSKNFWSDWERVDEFFNQGL
jgi:hypothetical protein